MYQYVALLINLVNTKLYSRLLNSYFYAELGDSPSFDRERRLKKT